MTGSESPDISVRITDDGYVLEFRGNSYPVCFPPGVWSSVPEDVKATLVDHLVFASTLHLPMKLRELRGLTYQVPRPFFEPHLILNALRDIPSCCDMDGTDIASETERFLSLEYGFPPASVALPPLWPTSAAPARAVVPLSFGKDSLLTYALAGEIGLEPLGVYVEEPAFAGERAHKEDLGRRLRDLTGQGLEIIGHDTGQLRDGPHLGVQPDEYGWGLQSTEYALLMLPHARRHGARYILFGNEQTAGARYTDATGRWTVHPCFDQSPEWTQHIDAITSMFTRTDPVRTGSLIEPLMDMMVQRILVRRYPQFAPLQMSCFAEGEAGRNYRWCHECSICAKMYLMCAGGGVDPSDVGFRRSLLTGREKKYFSIFGGESGFPYARTDAALDEQLFAFSCAARFGHDDPLVREFLSSPLADEARRREAELLERFASVHPSLTLPDELRRPVLDIFDEEIAAFRRQYGDRS